MMEKAGKFISATVIILGEIVLFMVALVWLKRSKNVRLVHKARQEMQQHLPLRRWREEPELYLHI